MWKRDEDRIALLELLVTGRLRRRSTQAEAWAVLGDLPWTRRTSRRDELEIVAAQEHRLLQLLDRAWPEWKLVAEGLVTRELDPTPGGLRRLRDLLRAESVTHLPARLNRRTATAAVAPHSKSGLGSIRRAALGDTNVTRDGIVRLRPPPGVSFARGSASVNAAEIEGVLGEVAIAERALLDGTVLVGNVVAALLVENLGAYQDLNPPAGWLVAHVPGWNTSTVGLFLNQLRDVPLVHFGDLDPAGVRIERHLRQLRPNLVWTVPEFWGEYLESRGLPGEWPDDLDVSHAPPLVRELRRRGVWLEQEIIALDSRLGPALESAAFGV